MEYSSIKNEAPMMPVPHAPAMGCVEAITKCFNNYANFNGRATRAEFWWF